MAPEILLDLAARRDISFSKNGNVLRFPDAYKHQTVTRNLLKIGFFAMNLHDDLQGSDQTKRRDMPHFVTGMAFHYALDAAPRSPGAARDTIDLIALQEQVTLIERHFGHIDIDPDIAADLARVAISLRGPAPEAGKGEA